MPFVNDTFTDTAGTALASHTPEQGGAWTKWFGSAAVISDANRLRGGGGALHYIGTPAGADYSVQADFVTKTDVGLAEIGLVARFVTTGSGNGYNVQWSTGGTDAFYLFKLIAGVYTQIGTYAFPYPGNDATTTVKLECIGDAIKVYINGTERISVTNSEVTAAGQPGIRTQQTSTDSTATHLDNFSATDYVAAASALPDTAAIRTIQTYYYE